MGRSGRGQGSPPPMRGKAQFVSLGICGCGITPAYAGKRYIRKDYGSPFRDHPRLCGEKPQTPKNVVEIVGSPPPMRGKDFEACKAKLAPGITPAYAGKRRFEDVGAAYRRDHPRLCGEKHTSTRYHLLSIGSPPPMRGKVNCLAYNIFKFGITPAYAGKSFCRSRFVLDCKDHPRLCGEKCLEWGHNLGSGGSPPPMRGKGPCISAVPAGGRITPAYAGKSQFLVPAWRPFEDHPRLCGEKHSKTFLMPVQRRITPAYAGKSAGTSAINNRN